MRYVCFLVMLLLPGCDKIKEILNKPEDISTSTQVTTTVELITTTITTEPTNPQCNGTDYPPDGPGGFLWKPVSESNGNVAVLLPGNFRKKFNICTIYDGKVADSMAFSSFSNPDKYGDRQTWRGTKPGGNYATPALVVCEDESQKCAWHIPTPEERID